MFETLKENLIKLGYDVSYFEDRESLKEYLKNNIKEKTIGFGGSQTLKELGLKDLLEENNIVYQHHDVPKGTDTMEIRKLENGAQIYISSVNGIALSGEIINIDGVGNRLASLLFGHEKVYLIIGKNKITKDIDEAIYRARNIAAVKNAQRLGVKTPCAINGDHCYDCKSPQRICGAMLIMWKKMTHSNVLN